MIAGPQGLKLFGVTLIGVTPENGRKLLLTVGFIATAWLVGLVLRTILAWVGKLTDSPRFRFWGRQVSGIAITLFVVIAVSLIVSWLVA